MYKLWCGIVSSLLQDKRMCFWSIEKKIKDVMGYWISCSFGSDGSFSYMTEKLLRDAGVEVVGLWSGTSDFHSYDMSTSKYKQSVSFR